MSFSIAPQIMRIVLAVTMAAAAGVGLAACNAGKAATSPSPSPSTAPASTGPSLVPVVGTPIGLGCSTLVPAAAIASFNPHFVPDPGYVPQPGSRAATIVKEKGLACRWVSTAGNDTIEVAVADLPSANITDLKDALVVSSNLVPTYGDEAYFKVEGGMGVAEVFSGPFWIVAISPAFHEPGDPTPIVNAAIKSLGR